MHLAFVFTWSDTLSDAPPMPPPFLLFSFAFVCAAVHPKTGRVCVPIDPAHVREFDPFVVPTLGQLARQIDHYDKEHGEEVRVGFQFHAFGRRFALERYVPCCTTIIYRLKGTHIMRFVLCTKRVMAYRVLSCVLCRCGGHPTVVQCKTATHSP